MRIALLIFALASFGPAIGAAPRIAEADAKAIRVVVQGQLDAFASDDGAKAFSYAAPGIRAQFGTPEVFMAMVREGYAVVYRPASVQFLPARVERGVIFQRVRMSDAEGTVWIVHYAMKKQKNGAWRIAGCQLERTGASAT